MQQSDKMCVIWGAGRIGRGFVADLLADAGYRILFVDQAQAVVDSLRERGQYTVVRATGTERQDRVIDGFEVLSTDETAQVAAALVAADLAAVAVFPRDLPTVARQMVPGLLRRRAERPDESLDILLCTNLAHAGPAFREPLLAALPPEARAWARSRIGVVESLVIRMVAEPPAEERERSPLLVWTNGYATFPVERCAFRGEVPAVPALRLVDDMRAEERRKLYTYNTFHAALAYLGALRGHVRVVDALADAWVRVGAEGALRESAAALQAEYEFAPEEMARWIEGVIAQTDNPALGDTVARYGADPRRKLRHDDRLAGPLRLARGHGIESPHLTRAIAAALLYRDPNDAGAAYVEGQVDALGPGKAVRALCGWPDPEPEWVEGIVRAYGRLPVEVQWAGYAEQAYHLGFGYERTYKGCGQCILAAVQDATGLFDRALFNGAFEAATGLAGGIGLCGDGTCSAFTGGALALGLYSPRRRTHFDADRESKYRAYDLIQRLHARYLAYYGGIRCCEIHNHEFGRAYDLRDPSEREAFEAAGAHRDKCTGVVARAARWVVEIIGEEQVKGQA
ncbi:MAG: C-GCAxxG-C-C family protein [Anaerolineae bacterium]|nr:C-GCAxxG-C-C family protein [Anaerolineae bacterium]